VNASDDSFGDESDDGEASAAGDESKWARLDSEAKAAAIAGSMKPDEKMLTMKLALKVADLGNLSKGLDYTMLWTDRVIDEFYAQGDDERARGLTVATAFDRAKSSRNHEQRGFIKFMVLPLYEMFAKLVPLTEQLENLGAMIEHYDALILADEHG